MRHQQRDRDQRDQPERVMTQNVARQPILLADERSERHAEDVRKRQPQKHQSDRARPLVGRNEAGRDDRPDTEHGAMREGRENARDEKEHIVWRDGGKEVADDKYADRQQEDALPRHLAGRDREDRRADHHAERIGRDDLARERDRDRKIARDIRQQSHHHELGRADAERTHRERQDRYRNSAPHRDAWGGLSTNSLFHYDDLFWRRILASLHETRCALRGSLRSHLRMRRVNGLQSQTSLMLRCSAKRSLKHAGRNCKPCF